MFKRLCSLSAFILTCASSYLSSTIQYNIHDIDTLQTHSSKAIAINNEGQILGWYNIDGKSSGKHYFLRDKTGEFREIPTKTPEDGLEIEWKFLKDNGKAYGIFFANSNIPSLCMWDGQNGFVNLGVMPGKNIMAINNSGQVLIQSVTEHDDEKNIIVIRPVIWQNGKITKLNGLIGDIGIESEESYGLDMNNNGEVVGTSVAYLVYKDKIYKQVHAVKWSQGEATDLHETVPKSASTVASTINDLGDVVVNGYLIRADGKRVSHWLYAYSKSMSTNYFYSEQYGGRIIDRDGSEIGIQGLVNSELYNDYNSIWMVCTKVVGINERLEAIADGTTIYGEQHAMFLSPENTN